MRACFFLAFCGALGLVAGTPHDDDNETSTSTETRRTDSSAAIAFPTGNWNRSSASNGTLHGDLDATTPISLWRPTRLPTDAPIPSTWVTVTTTRSVLFQPPGQGGDNDDTNQRPAPPTTTTSVANATSLTTAPTHTTTAIVDDDSDGSSDSLTIAPSRASNYHQTAMFKVYEPLVVASALAILHPEEARILPKLDLENAVKRPNFTIKFNTNHELAAVIKALVSGAVKIPSKINPLDVASAIAVLHPSLAAQLAQTDLSTIESGQDVLQVPPVITKAGMVGDDAIAVIAALIATAGRPVHEWE